MEGLAFREFSLACVREDWDLKMVIFEWIEFRKYSTEFR